MTSDDTLLRNAGPVVETRAGKVRGAYMDGVYAFKGIPYGEDTAGANRWKPPVPKQPWSGIRDCLDWGPVCPQVPSYISQTIGTTFFGANPDAGKVQSEDCLVLNIFTPALGDGGKRPVMVWLHGGGFVVGQGSGSRTNGANVARRQNSVQVTVNHRLGALGYLTLADADGEFGRAGMAGQLDLIAALQWIRDNIAAFGGDPDNVTIYGESGGGGKVATLMAMPGAQGLFHRAISQSGTTALPTAAYQAEMGLMFLEELQVGPDDLKRLQDLPVEDIIEAAVRMGTRVSFGTYGAFLPGYGVPDLPLPPLEAIAAGSARVPLIVGCTLHEHALLLAYEKLDVTALGEEQLRERIGALYANADDVIARYRKLHPDMAPGTLLERIHSDAWHVDSVGLAEAHIRGGGPATYVYLFAWESPVMPGLGAAHGSDGTFYHDNADTVDIAAGNPDAMALATAMSTAWATFARTGAPAASGLPEWPQYSPSRRETMMFDSPSRVVSDPLEGRLILADAVGP